MRRVIAVAFVLSLLFASKPPQVQAQTSSGSIRGTVVDSSGAAVPGAKVAAVHESTKKKHEVVSSANGSFHLIGLAAGPYDLRVDLSGFKTAEVLGLEVVAGKITEVKVTLEVGSLAETVTVDRNYQRLRSDRRRAPALAPTPPPPGYVPHPPAPLSLQQVSPPFNTEGYDKIDESGFKDSKKEPLSTFGADVDTASYANVRRFLTTGTLPPKDAVRTEEFLNYFRFDYPDAPADVPFSVTTEIGACPWKPEHRLVLIGLQGRKLDLGQLPPRNLVYLLDVSGSMNEPSKLPLLQAGLRMLTNNLTKKDHVAIVVYAGASGLVLPRTSGSDAATIVAAIENLRAGGSTNGGQGIELAYRIAREGFVEGGVNRVILATDGDFNVGITDMGSLTRLIEEERKTGVFLSVLGFGTGNVKDATMVKLADTGNGNYSYIDSLQEARKVLVQEAAGTLVTIAKDVKIQVEFNPARIGAYRLIGYEKRRLNAQDFKDDKKDAGEIGAGHTVTALYEVIPAGAEAATTDVDPLKYQKAAPLSKAAASDELMTVKLRFKEPSGDTSREIRTVVRDAAADVNKVPTNVGFASAVAEFGLLLFDSEYKGKASYGQVLDLARQHRGEDLHGHRGEFVKLVGLAQELTGRK